MSTTSLVSADDVFTILAILFSIVMSGVFLEKTKVGGYLSAPLIIIVLAIVFSNSGILPFTSPVYDVMWGYAVPLAIPLLLLRANIKKIIYEGGYVFVAFILAATGTILGAAIFFSLTGLVDDEGKAASALLASWIGGSANFVATIEALKPEDNSIVIAALAADNIVGNSFYLLLLIFASAAPLARLFPSSDLIDQREKLKPNQHERESEPGSLTIQNLAVMMTLSSVICAVGFFLEHIFSLPALGILTISFLSVLVANMFADNISKLNGDFDMGMFLMFLFFAAIGASADIQQAIESAPVFILFLVVISVCNLSILFMGGRLFKIGLPALLVGATSCALGAPNAAALAGAKGWNSLITPGILVGILGYAIGTYIGVFISMLLVSGSYSALF